MSAPDGAPHTLSDRIDRILCDTDLPPLIDGDNRVELSRLRSLMREYRRRLADDSGEQDDDEGGVTTTPTVPTRMPCPTTDRPMAAEGEGGVEEEDSYEEEEDES